MEPVDKDPKKDLPQEPPAEKAKDPAEGLKKYSLELGKWMLMVVAMLVATILGSLTIKYFGGDKVQIPPPPPVPMGPEADSIKSEDSEEHYFCGRIESYRDNFTTRPWPVKKITWTVDCKQYRGVISPLQIKEAFIVAWAAWTSHLDLSAEFTSDANKALVISRFGHIDGSGRVLAWSELADGTTTPKEQLYDTGERWEIAEAPKQIDLVRVACHEIGHVLGLVHDDQGSGALMAPTYDRKVRFPTARDIKRLLILGYKEKPADPNQPKPTIPPLNITIDAKQIFDALEKHGWKVERK